MTNQQQAWIPPGQYAGTNLGRPQTNDNPSGASPAPETPATDEERVIEEPGTPPAE